MRKTNSGIRAVLAAVMIIELAVCLFVTPGWIRRSGSVSSKYSYKISEDLKGMDITVSEAQGGEIKRFRNDAKYKLLSAPVSFECDDYDGTILGDDVLYTVDIPKDADIGRLVFVYFDPDGEARYLTPDIIDTGKGTMSVYLPHFSWFGSAELSPEEQIETFLDDYSMRLAIDRSEQKQAASELGPYVRAKVEALKLTKSATEDLIQSTLNYVGGKFKGTEDNKNKYGDTIETGTKAVTTISRGFLDDDMDSMQQGLEDVVNGAMMHCWDELKFSDRIDEVLGSEFAGSTANTLLGNAGGVARMAGYLMEGDFEDAASELGGVMQSVYPEVEFATKGAKWLASLGNMAYLNWKSNEIEELYQIYKNGGGGLFGNEVEAGDKESFLRYLNYSSGFTKAKGVARFYKLDNIGELCEKYGWDYQTYQEIPDSIKVKFEARAEEGLMEYFEVRRSQEAEAARIKESERACIKEMLNHYYGVLDSSNYKAFFGESSDKDFNMRSRLERLVNVRRFISQYVDEEALSKLGKSGYNYGTLLNEWIGYASKYKKNDAIDKFCDYLKEIGAYKSGSNEHAPEISYVGGDKWFVGTWSALETGGGDAYIISGSGGSVTAYHIKLSSVSEGSKAVAYSDFYPGTIADDGSYVLIDDYAWEDENGNRVASFTPVKLLRPTSGDGSRIEAIFSPSELCGGNALNEPGIWYKREFTT